MVNETLHPGDRVRTRNGLSGTIREVYDEQGRQTAYVAMHTEQSSGGDFDVEELTRIPAERVGLGQRT